jgi:hypothetical protein
LRSAATGQRFAILKLETSTGQPTFASVNLAIKRLDHLMMDQALTVTIPLQEPTAQGLTTNSEANALNGLEDDLLATLGHDAVYLGRETGQGERRIYFHVARAGPAEHRARGWVAQHGDRPIRIAVQDDARWEILRRW